MRGRKGVPSLESKLYLGQEEKVQGQSISVFCSLDLPGEGWGVGWGGNQNLSKSDAPSISPLPPFPPSRRRSERSPFPQPSLQLLSARPRIDKAQRECHEKRRRTKSSRDFEFLRFPSFLNVDILIPLFCLLSLLLVVQANELRVGSVIETENSKGGRNLAQITKYLYTQGSGRQLGVVQATLRDLRSGNKSDARWRPGDPVLEARLAEEPATLLYREGADSVLLMSDETFEQFSLPLSMLGAAAPYLADGARVVVSRAPPELGGDALSARAEAATAEVAVVSTPPARSGVHSSYQRVEVGAVVGGSSEEGSGTTTAGTATTATTIKAEVAVPSHVSAGDRIVVDLRDGTFVRRV